MLETRELEKSFGNLKVLKGIDIHIRAGITTAILGPNASGKTTLIKCILGQVHPGKGKVLLNDRSVKGQWKYRRNIGYLPQIASFPENLKVYELIDFVKDIRESDVKADHLVDMFDLQSSLDKKLKFLSGGTKQKVNLLLTFMFDCPLYILDEPTSGLDPVALIRFKQWIRALKENGKTILLTTHIMGLVEEIADEVVFLLEGRVYFSGTLNDLLKHAGESDLEHAMAGILMKHNVENP
jgi:Cu-processing system ATP-binding protein